MDSVCCVFQLPEGLQSLSKNLRTLDVSVNKLAVLPTYVGGFLQLKTLNIGNNRLSNILLPFFTLILDITFCVATVLWVNVGCCPDNIFVIILSWFR